MSIIEVHNLSRTYKFYRKEPGFVGSMKSFFARNIEHARAVDGISFSMEEGELVGFLGPNGAGKTTTLKMLTGLIEPTSGTASVLGHIPHRREKQYQKQFSLVMGQKNQLWEDLPAYDAFLLNKAIYELPDKEFKDQFEELVEVLDVGKILNVQTRKLSLGQRLKCELIAALLHNPKVLFLDEPTIGLDVVAQKNIREFVKKYNRERNTTVLLTSHYMEDIKELCERIIIINKGKIIYDGSLDKLVKKYAPHKRLTVTFNKEGVGREILSRFGKLKYLGPHRSIISVLRKDAPSVAASLLSAGLPVDDILIDEPDVNEVIRHIFEKAS